VAIGLVGGTSTCAQADRIKTITPRVRKIHLDFIIPGLLLLSYLLRLKQ
jgi:hypothetical protein